MDQEIASAITRAHFHPKALGHIRIMNIKRGAKGAITAITYPHATAERALEYGNIIITTARTVNKGVVDVEENVSCERLKINAVHLTRYMGKGTESLQKMLEQFEAENEGIVVPTKTRWQVNPSDIRERRPNREIAASFDVFFAKGSKRAQSSVEKGINEAGVWYRVKKYIDQEADSSCDLCSGSGHIENKCGSKPKCGNCSGHHRTSNHK